MQRSCHGERDGLRPENVLIPVANAFAVMEVGHKPPRGARGKYNDDIELRHPAPATAHQGWPISLRRATTFKAARGTKPLHSTNSGNFEPSSLRSEQ